MTDGLAEPGWYPVEGVLRYWDGASWTDHRRPLPARSRPVLRRERRPWWARAALVVILTALTAAAWWGWFGWHDLDDGDYQVWQGVGCVLCLLLLGIAAPRVIRPFSAVLTMTVAFTVAVGVDWIPEDESGLAAIGVFLLGFGMATGSTVVLFISDRWWRGRGTS